MRINKYLSECGICSRRQADLLIEQGAVTINGKTAENGMQAEEGDEIRLHGEKISVLSQKTYLAFHKPKGIVCTSEKREPNNLIDYLNYPKRITYAGRLDKDSEGLLLLTDDGDLIDALMTAGNGHEKEYVVTVAHSLTDEKLRQLSGGVYLEEIHRMTKPCRAWKSRENEFHIVLTQGINRQIRRMCKNLNLRVTGLKRIRVGQILLGDLPCGKYRELSQSEKEELIRLKEKTGKSNRREKQCGNESGQRI